MRVMVDWDTTDEEHPNGQDADLPKEVDVPNDIPNDDIADWLSDKYGWCVNRIYIKQDPIAKTFIATPPERLRRRSNI